MHLSTLSAVLRRFFFCYTENSLLLMKLTGSGRRLSREQKTGVVLLFVFAFLAVGLGLLQLRNTIYSPFVIRPAPVSTVLFADERTRLQKIDTDHDGLNDYEELEFYNTSPYLPDTDSDGVGDKEEIDAGGDPVCAEGLVCESAEAVPKERSSIVLPGSTESGLDLLGQASANTEPSADEAVSLEALAENPAVLRRLLLQSGKISEADLKKIDDATLLSIAKNLLSQNATSTQ